jgi:hypothetical protein
MAYRAVTHIALVVSPLRQAEEFYQVLFALEVAFREAEAADGWRTLPPHASWEEAEADGIHLGLCSLHRDAFTLALEDGPGTMGGRLSHIGVQVDEMDDIDTILERQSKTQLITLVKQLLQKQPEVEWQLTMPPLPGHKSVPIDTEEYHSQVNEAFRHAGREWDAVYGISSDLSQITATAARFARLRDYANAAAIYEVVAMGTLSHYLSYHDEDGALGRVVQDCVEGLGACLESEREDEALREQILETIFAVYCFDVAHGGFGLTREIPPEFLQDTTPEEKHLVAQWVRTALAELQEKKQESSWRLEHYGGLLLTLEADLLNNKESLRIGRETKSIQAVVTRLLELGRADEAVQDASQANGWQLLKLADLFVQYGRDAAIEGLMYEKAQQEMHTITAEWLKNHYLAKNNLAAALEMAQLIFRKRPWFAEYQRMREISMELGNWEAVRQEAHMFLETTKNISTLVEATLDEGDIERALQLLQATKPLALRAISGSTTMRAPLKLLLKPLNARRRHTPALR